MHLEIVNPDRSLFEGEVTSVKLPGSAGTFEVLKDHAPIISTLEPGQVRIRKADGSEENVTIGSGFVEVLNNKITVMV